MSSTTQNSAIATLEPLAQSSTLKKTLFVIGGALFLTAFSKIAVGGPIPMTLQTLAVMTIGLTMGARLAGATLVTYLAAGLVAPVFANAGFGPAYMLGGTGGYLLGFLAQVLIIGYLADKGFTRSWVGTFVALILGTVVMYALGVAWLTNLYGFDKAIEWGVVPFLLSEPVKIVLAALFGRGVLKGAGQLTSRF